MMMMNESQFAHEGALSLEPSRVQSESSLLLLLLLKLFLSSSFSHTSPRFHIYSLLLLLQVLFPVNCLPPFAFSSPFLPSPRSTRFCGTSEVTYARRLLPMEHVMSSSNYHERAARPINVNMFIGIQVAYIPMAIT